MKGEMKGEMKGFGDRDEGEMLQLLI